MKIEIYEPAMCCSTGICGANVNPELLRISTLVDNNKSDSVKIIRYNLNTNPNAFIRNEIVKEKLEKGTNELPITLVDGEVFKVGSYITNEELEKLVEGV
ncbi:arsenite efflux transporter metallochaperone ArsD [Erysipelothrix rhusiopathiae]|nr:arsenite efflux transporter metallochaperone ArsD [Erysipelothrix rhusiopathiae]MDE8269046.1 arsenite efflux transporter metallochaperone ArsD [Erysipelothrix rhusiopathiae]MDE8270685.1 arsenite efflux transporter metallochaperone ArsD [Erysipelothrix rhusiopathiae]MDE8279110.1 arsenite efflux transporter metallochaperone ArsD [Erysipelothrix rhusiopathiae]MDE8319404.1 arsenite efflux transporter metallochaperone ArsD [Erysipelothrix rhusiopathiae]